MHISNISSNARHSHHLHVIEILIPLLSVCECDIKSWSTKKGCYAPWKLKSTQRYRVSYLRCYKSFEKKRKTWKNKGEDNSLEDCWTFFEVRLSNTCTKRTPNTVIEKRASYLQQSKVWSVGRAAPIFPSRWRRHWPWSRRYLYLLLMYLWFPPLYRPAKIRNQFQTILLFPFSVNDPSSSEDMLVPQLSESLPMARSARDYGVMPRSRQGQGSKKSEVEIHAKF